MKNFLERMTSGKSDDELVRMSHVHRPWMKKMIERCPSKDAALEIGCWKGETTVWLFDQGFKFITAVDTFKGSAEHKTCDLHAAFQAATAGRNIRCMIDRSSSALVWLVQQGFEFDFIYVDGSHDSRDVIIDATLGFQLLAPGGVMIFDDYIWPMNDDPFRTPRPAIDFFLQAYASQITQTRYGAQVAVQKL